MYYVLLPFVNIDYYSVNGSLEINNLGVLKDNRCKIRFLIIIIKIGMFHLPRPALKTSKLRHCMYVYAWYDEIQLILMNGQKFSHISSHN
jgi:hypothetical protein